MAVSSLTVINNVNGGIPCGLRQCTGRAFAAPGGCHGGPGRAQLTVFACGAIVTVGSPAACGACARTCRADATGAGCPSAADVRAYPRANPHDS
jgi:hypothetical protein